MAERHPRRKWSRAQIDPSVMGAGHPWLLVKFCELQAVTSIEHRGSGMKEIL